MANGKGHRDTMQSNLSKVSKPNWATKPNEAAIIFRQLFALQSLAPVTLHLTTKVAQKGTKMMPTSVGQSA